MTPADFAAQLRDRTRTTSSTLPDATIQRTLKIFKDWIVEECITTTRSDYFGTIEVTDLIGNQREYPLPVDGNNGDIVIDPSAIFAYFDGTTPIKLKHIDQQQIARGISEDLITAQFTNQQGSAAYDSFRDSIVIYSGTIGAVVNGLMFLGESLTPDITDFTSVVDMSVPADATKRGVPKSLQLLLLDYCSIEIKSNRDKPLALTEMERNIEVRKKGIYNSLKARWRENNDKRVVPQDGIVSTFNNGYNL